jgi:hypothetical protein
LQVIDFVQLIFLLDFQSFQSEPCVSSPGGDSAEVVNKVIHKIRRWPAKRIGIKDLADVSPEHLNRSR